MRGPAGGYNRMIAIERQTIAPAAAGSGDLASTWTTWIRRPARLITGSGKELQQHSQQQSRVPWVIGIPYDSTVAGVTATDRVNLGGKILAIESATDVNGQGEELQLVCTETAP